MPTLLKILIVVLAVVTPAAAGTTTLSPQVVGTIVDFPILHQRYVQNGVIYSTCFSTTGENLEFRRGYMEFDVPVRSKRVLSATLTITETKGGWTATPFPPDVHEVSFYPADLVVDLADYDAPTVPLATFETDPNDPIGLRKLRFDVTSAIQNAKRDKVGFRIKLQIDPGGCAGFAGSTFGEIYIEPPRLEIVSRGR
jgi:hypothetical protein